MDLSVCLHGHFYQPPRENPWLESVELQDSARPFHDWNERITAECYAPNGAARILAADGRIDQIVNNYSRISFNFGPTLLSWMQEKSPETYTAILEADRLSRERFSGHGSALAQVYNHMILPLSNERDRWTQVHWGIRDFEHRFGRRPEGMWLAETAADTASLDLLAAQGIRFTILAPGQGKRTRKIESRSWKDVGGARIDPTMPYEVRLPSGRSIAVFFYDGPISRAIAFEGLLQSGERLVGRILGAASRSRDEPQLLHVATDGETYGHHHRHGEMALAHALHHIETHKLARVTNYGEHLERVSPTHRAEIHDNTSWSCSHGVERWWKDCGCNGGGHAGWNQAWRTPLRNALDRLRDSLTPAWEETARRLLRDPWAARNDYIDVVLDRSPENVQRFMAGHAIRELSDADRVAVLKLLELQRYSMLMYTSCGWFFDDLSGIETVQVIQYAGRAIQLARDVLGSDPEPGFLENLAEAKSNIPERGDGMRIYNEFVRPAMIDLKQVGAHYAISSLFQTYADEDRIHCYTVERQDSQLAEAGKPRLVIGRARIRAAITGESDVFSYGALHFGDHNVQAGIRQFRSEAEYGTLVAEARTAFERGDFPDVMRVLERHFEGVTYSLKSLFRDEQRRIVDRILTSTLEDAESRFRQIYETYAPLMRFLADLGLPAPAALHTAAGFVLNASLRNALEEDVPDLNRVAPLLDSAKRDHVRLDEGVLGYVLHEALVRIMTRLRDQSSNGSLLTQAVALAGLAEALPFEADFWKAQNLYYAMLRTVYPEFKARTDEAAAEWLRQFVILGDRLSIRAG